MNLKNWGCFLLGMNGDQNRYVEGKSAGLEILSVVLFMDVVYMW